TEKAEERQVAALDVGEVEAVGTRRRKLRGEGDDALTFGREAVDRGAPHRRIQRFIAASRALAAAEFEHPLGRALHADEARLAGAVDGRHESVAGVERNFRK